jgi:hypothetical protein
MAYVPVNTQDPFTMSLPLHPVTISQGPYNTPLFKFLVGPNKIEFNVHVDVIDRCSMPWFTKMQDFAQYTTFTLTTTQDHFTTAVFKFLVG